MNLKTRPWEVAEVVVVVAVPIVPADAAVHALLVGEVVVDAEYRVVRLDLFGQRRVGDVAAGPSRVARRSGAGDSNQDARATGLIRFGGMMLPGNGSCWNARR